MRKASSAGLRETTSACGTCRLHAQPAASLSRTQLPFHLDMTAAQGTWQCPQGQRAACGRGRRGAHAAGVWREGTRLTSASEPASASASSDSEREEAAREDSAVEEPPRLVTPLPTLHVQCRLSSVDSDP